MKNIIIFFVLLVGAHSGSFAQSMLKVSTSDRSVINVSVDGRYFNKAGQSVTVGDLPSGRHRVQIYATSQDRRGRAVQQIIYEGKVKTFQGAVTTLVFDEQSGQTDIQEQDMNNYTPPSYDNGNSAPVDNNNGNDGYSNNTPVASPDPQATLTDTKITKVKDRVAAKAADTQKMDLLKDVLKDESFTTSQVSTIMGWFIFESSKVDFAKWAYTNTVDKENFSSLENQFSYKNSQDDLEQFLQSQK